MAHSVYHAKSSVRKFGGTEEFWLPIHEWFDATKAIRADYKHRALRHNVESLELISGVQKFPANRKGELLAACYQHLEEDFPSKPKPTVDDWWDMENLPIWAQYGIPPIDVLTLTCTMKFGGKEKDYLELVKFFAQGIKPLRHHSWGIFDAESLFGTTFKRESDKKDIPTRTVAEAIVFRICGRIPKPDDWLDLVKSEAWMFANAKQLSKEED